MPISVPFARRTVLALLVLALAGFTTAVQAQCVSLATIGTAATENFDALSNTAASTTNALTIPGWFLTESGGGARDNELYAVDTGGSNSGDTYSYGSAGSTDRALGGLQSGTLIPIIGACFTNNTGATLTSLDLAYTGEQWRLGTAARTDQIDFQFSLDATDLTTGTWTDTNALDFVTPVTTTTGAKDGNAAANRTALASTIPALTIANGATFWIRWTDANPTGADDGLAIDDFSITPQGLPPPTSLTISDVVVIEGNAGTVNAQFTVSLSSPAPAGGVSFDIATTDGTATVADNDYVARSLTGQTIAAGASTFTFDVTVNGDLFVEPNENFVVQVSNLVGAAPSDTGATGFIDSDDFAPALTVADVVVIEGNAGTVNAQFTVSLGTPAPPGGVSFDIATTDGTATVADNDYVARSLTGQTIAAGASTFTFDVTVNGDLFVEPNENFVVQVSNLVGAAPSDTGATGFIDSDDFAPALTVADVVVIEGNAGTVNAQFTVSLGTPAPPGGVSFDIATTDGTATVADNDYVARSLTGQTIAAGASTFTFDVTVNGDNNIEPNENFVVQVSNLVGAAPSDTGATGFIDNDDAAPNLSIDDVTVTEGNAGTTTASFTVSLSNPAPAGGVSFDIATADGSATVADNDYVARSLTGQTIAAGASSFAFDVTINGDTVFEANETFNVDVGNVTGATVVDGQGVGTITNDDTSSDLSVTVSVAPNPVIPGDALTYTVNGNNAGPDAASNAQVSLSFATAFASLSGPAGWSCSTPAIGAAGTVTCNIASLPVGAFSFTVQATVPFGTAPGDLSATASIGADNSDPTPANNASTTVVTVVAGPSLPVVPVPVLHGQLALWLAALFMGLGLVAVARRGS